jgi:hypothetical protein
MDVQIYINQIHELGSRLQNDSRFKVVFETYPTPRTGDLEDLESIIRSEPGMEDFKICDQIREFYQVSNGFRLQWQYLDHDDQHRITTGSTAIASILGIYLPDEEEGQPYSLIYERPRIFDDIGNQDYVAMRFSRDVASPKLLYKCRDSDRVHELGLDFNRYLELLLQARAMYRWQQFFITDDSFRPLPGVEDRFRSDLKQLFSEVDLSPFTFNR